MSLPRSTSSAVDRMGGKRGRGEFEKTQRDEMRGGGVVGE
jgi:hypothetical protein